MARLLALLLARHASRWVTLGLLATLACRAYPARAAVTEAWVHRYNNVLSNSVDQAVKVVSDAAGDIIVTGSTEDGFTGQDMLTIKYSGANGSVLWQKRYNSPGNGDDQAFALAVDGSGNVVVTGTSYSDYYTAKYAAADGALLWEKHSNGGGQAVAVDASGNVVVTGTSYYDYYTAKYAAGDGALLWERRYNGPANSDDRAQAVAVDGSGNVVVTGYSYNNTNWTDPNYYTAKYAAADGALLWERRYNGPGNYGDVAQAVAVDGTGNVIVTGSSDNETNTDYYTAKYAAVDGALLWEKRYNGPANYEDGAQAVAVDGSGNVVVTGYSGRSGSRYDYYTVKYAAADGVPLWEQRYDGSAVYYFFARPAEVTVDSSGNVLVAGPSYGSPDRDDYYTAKYAADDGALLWEKRYNGPANNDDQAQAVAVDVNGNVVVTGSSMGSKSSYDYFTAKYAAADGALLWTNRYNGLANREDSARAVAVDGSGNVVVTGTSYNGAAHHGYADYWDADYYTAKYAAADGTLLWENRYNGYAGYGEGATAVALDGSGNVVVTGWSYDTNGQTAYYTAKYATADGALLWEKRTDGGESYYGEGDPAVAVDGNGNVVVTGSSGLPNSDYYTAKYAAADGALLWEKRYNGPANLRDYANAVAVDASGNVVVTGGSASGGSFSFGFIFDYYTAKYAAADGALLWDKRYTNGIAYTVAVDASGNVVVTGSSATIKYLANGTGVWTNNSGATALAVDGSGNVLVTGSSHNGTNNDYYTAKYASADGALLWEKRYNGPANGYDHAYRVAVDSSGNVVVTGRSYNRTNGDYSNGDYYTAKYAAADGALLWEQRYNGPANGEDSATSLALGPNGMVAVTGSSSSDYATVVYRENLPPVAIERVLTSIRLRFTGVPGRSYNIERAPAVTGPWSILATPTAPLGGLIEYADTNAPVGTAFYRTNTP